MRNGKIYWVKQKLVGLLLIILPWFFVDVFVANDAAILIVAMDGLGLMYLFTKERLFRSDYIFDLREFLK